MGKLDSHSWLQRFPMPQQLLPRFWPYSNPPAHREAVFSTGCIARPDKKIQNAIDGSLRKSSAGGVRHRICSFHSHKYGHLYKLDYLPCNCQLCLLLRNAFSTGPGISLWDKCSLLSYVISSSSTYNSSQCDLLISLGPQWCVV